MARSPFIPALDTLVPKLDDFEKGHLRVRWKSAPEMYASLDRSKLSLWDLYSARLTCHVENYCQLYTISLEGMFDHHPVMHKFLEIWDLEECNHGYALRDWLIACGMPEDHIVPELAQAREKGYVPPVTEPAQVIAYVYFQELLTATFYRLWQDKTQEPALKALLQKIIVDEFRHFDWYNTVMKAFLKADREAAVEATRVVARDFAMPGMQIVPNYEDLTNHLSQWVDFGPMTIMRASMQVIKTYGIIDGTKILTGSSYARDYRERDKQPPKSAEEQRSIAEHIAEFERELRLVLQGDLARA